MISSCRDRAAGVVIRSCCAAAAATGTAATKRDDAASVASVAASATNRLRHDAVRREAFSKNIASIGDGDIATGAADAGAACIPDDAIAVATAAAA